MSKLNSLRPEVATEVIKQFPELVGLIKSVASEYHGVLSEIIESDDKSIEHVYASIDKQQESDAESRKQFYEMANDIVNIALHFFLKDIRSKLLLKNHNIAVV